VGGLPYRMTNDELRDLFSEAGEVTDVYIVTERETGRSKGFGFVEMSTEEEAQAAIEKFHDEELDGRNITVNIAKPKNPPTSDNV